MWYFYKWIYDIEFTDPMIGCQEYFIEIFPKEKKNISFAVKNKTKFKVFLYIIHEKWMKKNIKINLIK